MAIEQRATKQQFIDAIQRLPDDATLDEILERIYVILKFERGDAAGESGDEISLEEAREEAKGWASE
jgi:hypothetical protein